MIAQLEDAVRAQAACNITFNRRRTRSLPQHYPILTALPRHVEPGTPSIGELEEMARPLTGRTFFLISEQRMSPIKDVSGTAFVVAEFRAEENSAAAPLYQDAVVGLFLSEESRHAAGLVEASFPPVKDMVKVRTKYFDDTLEQHILSQFRQVVILGAGLDTRAVRKQAAGVTYFEIDDVATLTLKHACYERHGIDANVKFIPGNYVTDGLIDLLKHNGFDFDLPTYFIWEGNTMYLPMGSVKHIPTELRRHVKQFRLSFDYLAEAVISKTTGDSGITSLVESFARMGAPWLSGIGDTQSLAREMGLKVVDNFKTSELCRTYWPDRPMTSPIFDYYCVCTLGC
jgi:methyltransferase (TIGR00027 family)